jgi:transposase
MANQLRMAVVDSVYTLLQQGHSRRQIARRLGLPRDTVRRAARLAAAEAKPARALTGSDAAPPGSPDPPDSKPAGAPPGSVPSPKVVQASHCEPFRELILGKLDQGLSAQRIYQDLVAEHGFTAQYHSVRRFVQKLGQASPLPFRRMECEPGAEAQVDFGTGAPVIIPEDQPLPFGVKTRRRTHVFRVVLSHSRKAYSEAVFRQTTEDFIRCLENAFWHFGGVPQTLVIDNRSAELTAEASRRR